MSNASAESSQIYRAGLTRSEWKAAIKFDGIDWGWVIMSIGMAIGAGIVFLPVQVGLQGLWVFLLSSIIGYPAMYLFQRLFINTLAEAKVCVDYPSTITGYLGKNWGALLGLLYFVMLIIWVFVYSTALNNDSASFLETFGIISDGQALARNPLYGLIVICILVALASRGEKILFKMSTFMVLTKLGVIAVLGCLMIPHWDLSNVMPMPPLLQFIKEAIVMLPFTLTSILFIQSLSPMVISYRGHNKNVEVARFKAMRAMNIAFIILFVTVFFYAVSFNLSINHEEAVNAHKLNISALAMVASSEGTTLKIFSLILNIFAVITAYFSVSLGFRESCQGLATNFLKRYMPEENINKRHLRTGILIFTVIVSWGAIVLNAPVLSFTSICSPIFGMVGCLIPAYLVYRVPALSKYRSFTLWIIIATGFLLILSPFLAFLA